MSPQYRQSVASVPSGLRGEDPFWIHMDMCDVLRQETLRLFGGLPMTHEHPPAPSAHHPQQSFDDSHLGSPSAPGYVERANDADFTLVTPSTSFYIQHDNLFGRTYQATYAESHQSEYDTCVPAQTVATFGHPLQPPTTCGDSVASTSNTHFLSTPIDPSVMMAYAPPFDHNCESQVPSTPENTTLSSSSTSPPTLSSCSSSPSSGGEGDADYVPPSDFDGDYLPGRSTSSQKQKRKARTKALISRTTTSAYASSSESGRSVTASHSPRRARSYRRPTAPRNFQSQDGARLTDVSSEFRCSAPGCKYVQKNRRVPDLKRHMATHSYLLKPDKWTCCGIATEDAHLYGIEIRQGATREELIKEGAYVFRGKLMIGGCMGRFTRRDALKRHLDNPNFPCVGNMESYPH